MAFNYLLARGNPRTPATSTANNFADFSTSILSKRVEISITPAMTDEERRQEKQKLYWFAPPTNQAGQRRIVANMAPCPYGCLDIDEATPGAIPVLLDRLGPYSAFAYQTASHTPEVPRLRVVFEYCRAVTAAERGNISTATETLLMQLAGFTLAGIEGKKAKWVNGVDRVVFDRGVYSAQSYFYCPDAGAESYQYTGEAIDVDALPLPVAPPKTKKGASKGKGKKQRQRDAEAEDFDDLDALNAGPDTFLVADLRSALSFPKWQNPTDDYDTWIENGIRLSSLKGTEYEDDVKALWHEYSARSSAYQEGYTEEKWEGFTAERSSYRAIFAASQALGWNNPGKWRARAAHIGDMKPSTRGELLAQYYGNVCLKADGNMVYRYTGQGWEHIPDAELIRQLSQIFKDNKVPFTPYEVKSAIEAMGMLLPLMGDTPRNLIGFANGVYDIEAQHFRPHCPEDWLTCHNGVEYAQPVKGENLKDHAPSFYRWLSHSADSDTRKMERIKAALYMVLANRYDWQLFIEVTGAGGSGKSVLTGIARMLAGELHTTSGTMEDMDIARERASFVGKSLITLPDQATYTGSGSGIKAITGGDVVRIDPKHEKPFHTIIRAVVIATNNEPMRFTERQGGISRRRVIFPLNREVSKAERDPALGDKIKAELSVIVRCLLVDFEQPSKAEELLIEQRDSVEALQVKNDNDPMYGFCSQLNGLPNPDGMYMGNAIMARNPLLYLYHAYLAYLDAHGYQRTPTLPKFSGDLRDTLKAFGVVLEKHPTGKGYRYNVTLSDKAREWLEGGDEEAPLTL